MVDKEEKRKYDKEYYQKSKGKIRKKHQDYYQRNKNKIKTKVALYQKTHRKERTAYSKTWKEETGYYKKVYRKRGQKVFIYKTKGKIICWMYSGGQRVHCAIAEKVLGRRLKKNECVHHFDGNSLNNLHKNLLICLNNYHAWLEMRMGCLYKKEHFRGRLGKSVIQKSITS